MDEDYMDFMSDTLFSTIAANQPFAFPDTREIGELLTFHTVRDSCTCTPDGYLFLGKPPKREGVVWTEVIYYCYLLMNYRMRICSSAVYRRWLRSAITVSSVLSRNSEELSDSPSDKFTFFCAVYLVGRVMRRYNTIENVSQCIRACVSTSPLGQVANVENESVFVQNDSPAKSPPHQRNFSILEKRAWPWTLYLAASVGGTWKVGNFNGAGWNGAQRIVFSRKRETAMEEFFRRKNRWDKGGPVLVLHHQWRWLDN